MLFSRRKKSETFDVASAHLLDLADGPVSVSIGHLANEAHTNAFVAIFEKLMSDNAALLAGFNITSIEAKRSLPSMPLTTDALITNPRPAAMALYSSDNDKVVFHLTRDAEKRTLLILFDDPYFLFK
jgi:hypothetical protein